jgi:CRP-like cAMP-binding protein
MDSAKSDYIRTLRRLPLFTDLSDAELAQIAEGVSRLYFEEGTLIFGEGDVCRDLLIVEEGTVKMVKSALSGRQQLLGIERKGSSLAEVAVFGGGRYPASAEATSSTTLLRLSADSFRQTCLKNSEMALKVFKVLAHRLRHLVSLVEELSFASSCTPDCVPRSTGRRKRTPDTSGNPFSIDRKQ